jgi:hypothetical protein
MPANTDHSVFQQPSNPNVKIWRYMDFAKYVALLEDGALWFSRADKLGESFGDRLGDPFEGTLSHATLEALRRNYSGIENEGRELSSEEDVAEQVDLALRTSRLMRQWTYVNSWHMNERESAAMWRLYARSNEAVAIQSTYSKLRDCLPSKVQVGKPDVSGIAGEWNEGDSPVYLGIVQYIDYGTEPISQDNAFYPFVHKRKSFEHEQELRAVISSVPFVEEPDGGMYIPESAANLETGCRVRVSLDALIEGIYVAPTAPTWFRRVVQAVTSKYDLAHKTARSSLDAAPLA